MPRPEILEKELEKLTKKPEVKNEFKYGIALHTNYFWSNVNDFIKEEGYSSLDPMIFYEGQFNLTPHFTLFAGAGKSEKAGSSLNMASYGLLLRTEPVFENLRFFIGAGIANGKLDLNGDKYTLDSYLLKTGLKLKLGMLELGGGYNYFPREWKTNSALDKDIDSSGAYGYIGLYYEIE